MEQTKVEKDGSLCAGHCYLLGFVLLLRGPECFMVETYGLITHLHFGIDSKDFEKEEK